MYIGRQGTGM